MNELKTAPWINKLTDWDISTCLYFNNFCRRRTINHFFAVISRLGDGVFWYSLAAVIPIIYGMAGLNVSATMIISGLVCVVIYKQLKNRLVRERPFIKSKEIYKGCAPLDRYSFPSGHTMHAACFSTVVLWNTPELSFIVLPFAFLVAVSRMVLGMHYPSDVICGAVLGILLGASANHLLPVDLVTDLWA